MNEALEAITQYLNGNMSLDALEERITLLAWDENFEDQELVDLVSIEIACINDGVSNESIFRARASRIAGKKLSTVI